MNQTRNTRTIILEITYDDNQSSDDKLREAHDRYKESVRKRMLE